MTLKYVFENLSRNWNTTKLQYVDMLFSKVGRIFFVDKEYFEIHICQFAVGEKRYFVNQN